MGALVTVCFRNTNVLMVWAWVLWSAYALGTQTLLWFGHGCYSAGMLLEHERYYGLGMDATKTVCSWNTNLGTRTLYGLGNTLYGLGNGCSGQRMLLKHERSLWFGMGALVTVCPRTQTLLLFGGSRTETLLWFGGLMLWSPYALRTPTF